MKRNKSRQDRYITRLAADLKAFRAKEKAGEYISPQERRNIRARERRAIQKMTKTAEPLIQQANETLRKPSDKPQHLFQIQLHQNQRTKSDRYRPAASDKCR